MNTWHFCLSWSPLKGFFSAFSVLAILVSAPRAASQVSTIPVAESVQTLAVLPDNRFAAVDGRTLWIFREDGTIERSQQLLTARVLQLAIENDRTLLVQDFSRILRADDGRRRLDNAPLLLQRFALQPDGRFVLLDTTSVSRWNLDGTEDTSFAEARLPASVIFDGALAIQGDGKIVVGGSREGLLARLNPDGTPDEQFNPPVLNPASVIAIVTQPDGKILVGGGFQRVGGVERSGIVRLNADGTLDTAFNPALSTNASVHSIALQANGKIILRGSFEAFGSQPATNIARLTAMGELDTSFPLRFIEGAAQPRSPLALQQDGTVLTSSGSNVVLIANSEPGTQSLERSGSTLTWLRSGGSPEIYHARFQASTDGVIWSDLGSAQRVTGGWQVQNATFPEGARFHVRGYVSGTSAFVDYVPGAPALLSQPQDRTNEVNTATTFRISAQGLEPLSFQWHRNDEPLAGATASELVLTNLTGGDAGSYFAVVRNSEGASTSRVAQLTVIDPIMIHQPDDAWINAGEILNLSVSARGTGLTYQWLKNDQPLPGATSSNLVVTNAAAMHNGIYKVLLTGTYGSLESVAVSVRVNHVIPENWTPSFESTSEWFPIQGAAYHNHMLFVGGLFRTLAAPVRTHLAKFAGDGSVVSSFDPAPSGGNPSGVNVVAVASSGQVLVGGSFLNIAGSPQPYLARLFADGTLDEGFDPQIEGQNHGEFTQVNDIEFQPDGKILIAGNFSTVNGQDRPGLARLLEDGSLDESFVPDIIDAPVVSWGILVQPDGKIIAYGWNLRRFHPDGTLDTEFFESITADLFGKILLLPNNQMLVEAQAGVMTPTITLLNNDGTVDESYRGPVRGSLEGLQADGKILATVPGPNIIHSVTTSNGTTTQIRSGYAMLRFNPDGSEDPGFSPMFDNIALFKAFRPDGGFFVGGRFTNVAGVAIPGLAQLRNLGPASQTMTFDGTNVVWLRGGASPEVSRTAFQYSSDGRTWTNLGAGVRIPGGWRITDVSLPRFGTIRAQGFLDGSLYESALDIAGLRLGAQAQPSGGGSIMLTAAASSTRLVELQTSTDLRSWTTVRTNLVGVEPLEIAVTNKSEPHAFFRLFERNNP